MNPPIRSSKSSYCFCQYTVSGFCFPIDVHVVMGDGSIMTSTIVVADGLVNVHEAPGATASHSLMLRQFAGVH